MITFGLEGNWIDTSSAASSSAYQSYFSLRVPQINVSAQNANVTTPVASSLLIAGPPIASTNQTITVSYALNVASGTSRFNGPVILTNSLSVGTTTTLASVPISGSSSATSGGLLFVRGPTFTDTSTAASGTAAAFNGTYLAPPTLAASNTSVTTSNASTLTIGGAPTAGTNATITNAYAFTCNGLSQFNGNLGLTGRIVGGVKDFVEFSLNSGAMTGTVANGQMGTVVWNTTPTNQTGYPTYSTALWTNGSTFAPGIPGLYLIIWTANSNTVTATGSNELFMFRNTTNGYNTPNQLALANLSMYSNEMVLTALLNVTQASDYVYFGWNNGNATAVAYSSGGGLGRNYLRIVKL